MTWEILLNRIAHWQKIQFPLATTESTRKHLEKEVTVELAKEPDSPEEWADILFFAIQGGVKASRGELRKFFITVQSKMDKNADRTWPNRPDFEGVYEHLRTPSTDEIMDNL